MKFLSVGDGRAGMPEPALRRASGLQRGGILLPIFTTFRFIEFRNHDTPIFCRHKKLMTDEICGTS